ncbi:histone-lysine N-methyltransferase SETMAR [Anabrus simplex]|uniref:histone-lysine N-methyltransferase SETMAR n=1 Tax=Anabrus simplex TaxID=316456 RepID=UPI0035A2EC63
MEKTEIRAVIKYFVKKGMKAKEIHADFQNTLGDSAPSFSTVAKWTSKFKFGRESLDDDPRSGQPKSVTNPEFIAKVHKMVMEDRRLKVREIAEAVGMSSERIYYILTEELGMKKLTARWVSRLLTLDNKRTRLKMSKQSLARFQCNQQDFLCRFVTTDETWVHYYTPETKQQSKQWKHADSPPPKKAKAVRSAGKVMASVFWDAKGILLIDYLPTGQTITGQYYANLLDQLQEKIRETRPGLARKKVIFHQDNAPPHTSVIAMAKLHELGYELLPHPPYSPDLAPSDFHLFPKLKIFLGGQRFSTREELTVKLERYFTGLEESHFRDGIKAMEYRWTKCISLQGNYVEK